MINKKLLNIFKDKIFKSVDLDNSENLYNLKNVRKIERINPNRISYRKKISDFSEYKKLFDNINQDLLSKKRKLIEFDAKIGVKEGKFYILGGIICLIKKLNLEDKSKIFQSGERNRLDGKIDCIFSNGTYSDMLFRSINKAISLDGFTISDPIDNFPDNNLVEEQNDTENGYIYILKSLSEDQKLRNLKNLYKIGFTIRNIEDRTKNAKDDPTYLLADVKVVALYKCLNLNSQKLEHLLHKFFYEAKLDIKIHNINSEYSPKEWFDVPLSVIDEVINIAIKGNIENYKYEKKLEQIIMI